MPVAVRVRHSVSCMACRPRAPPTRTHLTRAHRVGWDQKTRRMRGTGWGQKGRVTLGQRKHPLLGDASPLYEVFQATPGVGKAQGAFFFARAGGP